MNFKLILIGLLLVLFSTPIFALSDANLVAYYNFDEESGTTLIDVKGYDQNGVNTNATINQTGKINKAYTFNGTTSHIHSLPLITNNSPFTITAWIYPTVTNLDHIIYNSRSSTGEYPVLSLGLNTNKVAFILRDSLNSTPGLIINSTSITPNNWYFITATYSGADKNGSLYLNGVLQGTVINSDNGWSGINRTYIGAGAWNFSQQFNGLIDEIGIFDKNLSQTEINELYNSGNGLTYPFSPIYADFDYSINNLQVDLNDTSYVDDDVVIDSWEWLIDGVSVSTNQNYSFTGTELTDYNVCLTIQDTTLSLEDSICQTVSIGDITPPVTTFTSNQVPNTTDQNITLTCTDNNTGCKTINYNIDSLGWNSINYNRDYNLFDTTEYSTTLNTYANVKTWTIESPDYNKYIKSIVSKFDIDSCSVGKAKMLITYNDNSTTTTNEITANETYENHVFTWVNVNKPVKTITLQMNCGSNQVGHSFKSKDANFIFDANWITTPSYNFIYSGAGQHSIQYFSTNNSNNNETTKTSNFTTYGLGKFTFYDENSLNLLNSINYTITPSINGVSSGTTNGNTLDLNLQGITTGTYTFTFTKTGYETRYYTTDLNQYTRLDINFALIPESLSKEIQFRFYKPDQTTSYNNVYITASKNPQGFVLSRLKTDATGLVTFNLDQNSTGITFDMNNGENTYNSVILTINKPKDEQTLIDINANWSYNISGLASYTDSNATTATKVFAIYSNTVNTYSVLIGSTSTVPTYTTRKYDIQVFGDTNTYTLQPYLINTTDSIQTTIFTINPYTNQAISDVTIKIYRTLPLTGRTLIEQTITDSKGQSIVYLVLNQTYSFEISVGTTTIRTETYTITGTSSTIYFKVDPGYDLSTTPMQTSIYSFWTPGKNSLNKADRNISAKVSYGTNKNSVTVSSIILNCYNNLDLNQVLLFQDSFGSPTMNFIQTYDFNLTTKTLNSVTFDTNYSITCNIYTTLSDGNLIVSRQTYTMNNDDPQTNLGTDLRPFFGCSSTTDPNLPCPSMILAAVFITMMVITGIMIESGFTQPEFAGILFLIGLGFFTFFTWIPPVLYVIMLVIGLLIYVALGVRRI